MSKRWLPEFMGLALLCGWYFTSGTIQLVVAAILVLLIGAHVSYGHSGVVHGAFAIALGLVPFGSVPGVNVSVVLLLVMWMWMDALIHWDSGRKVETLEFWVLGLLVVSAISVLASHVGDFDYSEFLKWAVATSVVFPLSRLPVKSLVRTGKFFACAVAVAALIGILLLTVDKSGVLMRPFSALGYIGGTSNETVFGSTGQTQRLTGTFLNPNGGGIFLLIAIFISIALFNGYVRMVIAALLVIALALTLSRAALGGLVAAAIFSLILHPMNMTRRARTSSILALGFVAALLTPAVSTRLSDSFGSSDYGSRARGNALAAWPHQLSGHWIFGLGWGRPEFLDPLIGLKVNYVANAPLLAIYRGGLIVGFLFIGVLVVAGLLSYAAVTSTSGEAAAIGSGFLGLVLVTLQLDFPVVTIAPITAVFSLFLAFVIRSQDLPPVAGTHE